MNTMSRIVISDDRLAASDLDPEFALALPDQRHGQDEQIQFAVTTALLWDLAVPRHRVAVRVSRGWVTLTGKVERAYEKSCAEADARTISGVIGVINQIDCEAL